jgi:hypothetical protein
VPVNTANAGHILAVCDALQLFSWRGRIRICWHCRNVFK